jgi:hypothetical protein
VSKPSQLWRSSDPTHTNERPTAECARRAPLTPPGRRRGDQQHGLLEAGIDQGLLDLARELEVEGIFRDTPRAHCTGHIGGVADIDHNAE